MLSLSSAHAHIEVSNYWARLVPNGMGALYLEIKNSHTEPDVLIRAASPNAKSLMIHETQRKDNITSMKHLMNCLLYTSPSPRDSDSSRMPSSA